MTSTMMTEKELLNDLLNQQKQLAGIYAVGITETSMQDMRRMLTKQHHTICQDQFQVFTQMNQRGYYKTKSAAAKDVNSAKTTYSKVRTTMK